MNLFDVILLLFFPLQDFGEAKLYLVKTAGKKSKRCASFSHYQTPLMGLYLYMVLVSHDRENVHEQLNRKRKEKPNSVDEEEVNDFNIKSDFSNNFS